MKSEAAMKLQENMMIAWLDQLRAKDTTSEEGDELASSTSDAGIRSSAAIEAVGIASVGIEAVGIVPFFAGKLSAVVTAVQL